MKKFDLPSLLFHLFSLVSALMGVTHSPGEGTSFEKKTEGLIFFSVPANLPPDRALWISIEGILCSANMSVLGDITKSLGSWMPKKTEHQIVYLLSLPLKSSG